jgi:hypothetical protein
VKQLKLAIMSRLHADAQAVYPHTAQSQRITRVEVVWVSFHRDFGVWLDIKTPVNRGEHGLDLRWCSGRRTAASDCPRLLSKPAFPTILISWVSATNGAIRCSSLTYARTCTLVLQKDEGTKTNPYS